MLIGLAVHVAALQVQRAPAPVFGARTQAGRSVGHGGWIRTGFSVWLPLVSTPTVRPFQYTADWASGFAVVVQSGRHCEFTSSGTDLGLLRTDASSRRDTNQVGSLNVSVVCFTLSRFTGGGWRSAPAGLVSFTPLVIPARSPARTHRTRSGFPFLTESHSLHTSRIRVSPLVRLVGAW
ncbi:FAD/FMN-containing dehydrogenase [Pseudomonas phage PIP]|nr:FAD/FMN-containing dehydrogenase [Pseudomonas phage PIP]